ncbi:MAG: SPOR domain-containing protein, partial [Pseudomonadota bacterium]|nr:SPOR domain-containing protein [Pseudomonadota bacterium]
MAFFKFRQRGHAQPAPEPKGRRRKDEPATGPQETIDTLRRRARHRLVGAAVLVAVAVVGFPLLFDTQPRPVAVNAPITIPDKNDTAPLRLPADTRVAASASLDEREEVVSDTAPAPTPAPAPAAQRTPAGTDDAARARQEEAARSQREEQAQARREAQEREARAKREAEAQAKREAEA